VCFSVNNSQTCTPYANSSATNPFKPNPVPPSAPIDVQIGWEVQKFMIAWTLSHITANQKTNWTDMMALYRIGENADPQFENRIEWQDPQSGEIFYARTYGKECIFGKPGAKDKATCEAPDSGGKWVQKGIAARVLEYANMLTSKGYQLDETTYPAAGDYPAGFNQYGRAMFMRHPDGNAIVVPDPAVKSINAQGNIVATVPCDQNTSPSCTQLTIDKNHNAFELKSYKSVPSYLWESGITLGLWGDPHEIGLYP
jgi:hypothetical protein